MRWMRFWGLAMAAVLLNGCGGSGDGAAVARAQSIGHVFIIVLENKDFDKTFGEDSLAPYLAKTLPAQGALLKNYYGTGHLSMDNYVAMISGQGPNVLTQSDCLIYGDFVHINLPGLPLDQLLNQGQAIGEGCIYPVGVPNITDQFRARGIRWRGYMEDMGNDPEREAATCAHPPRNTVDNTQSATATDNYTTRHNPFMYFRSIIDDQAYCDDHVVNLEHLRLDLARADTTRAYNFIVPGLCHDGHDAPCANGEPGGLESINDFLQEWVPLILASEAFRQDGLLIITFDESDGPQTDSSACCGAAPTLNTPLPGITGLGGGRVGAVLLSPFITPGTVSEQDYNHYSMLRSVQDIFGLEYLGFANHPRQQSFGSDVYSAKMPEFGARQ
ncbi:alkaline phosphatase family protein [Sinimarinibacterium sp. NLF-5-8]|uniref:alkaline phosphatase family protein n=1 Tax=Sinimarinibacterium sp. NLF-5-8 TaxID=2698684 RepID=UPI00137BE876|nr:alkaline phosphatase family protein [Sinimarinibacterium sp. NLF-5-8]QHS10661.1 phosphoesterase [Sinimarinibacterium sp. NLF-5-8]